MAPFPPTLRHRATAAIVRSQPTKDSQTRPIAGTIWPMVCMVFLVIDTVSMFLDMSQLDNHPKVMLVRNMHK